MKKTIASALAVLLASLGFVVVDKDWTHRVEVLESQVEILKQYTTVASPSTTAKPTTTSVHERATNLPCINLPADNLGVGVVYSGYNAYPAKVVLEADYYVHIDLIGRDEFNTRELCDVTINEYKLEIVEVHPLAVYYDNYEYPYIGLICVSGTFDTKFVGKRIQSAVYNGKNQWDYTGIDDVHNANPTMYTDKRSCIIDENGNFDLHYYIDVRPDSNIGIRLDGLAVYPSYTGEYTTRTH